MSKASTTLKAIKTALGMDVKLATMKLEDGVTVIEAEVFEEGNTVNILTEDEQRIALPEGEYILEDGMVLRVEEEGIIASVSEMEVKEEEKVEEEVVVEDEVAASNKPSQTVATPKKVVEAVTKESYFTKEEVSSLIESKLAELKLELSKEEVKEEVDLSSEEMAVKPISHNPESNNSVANVKYAQNRTLSTFDKVMQKISNK
tara:strand:- start:231 stop:839 length:609 start_codon:yes stop_codon:yes gene_type:complete